MHSLSRNHSRPLHYTLVLLVQLCLASDVDAASPPLILADVYQKGMVLTGYWVSEKYDGVRAYWNGEQLISRQGNTYHAPSWFTRRFPERPLDGELWMGRGRFSELSGAVRRIEPSAEDWRQIHFMVFDLPDNEQPFDKRVIEMRALLVSPPSSYITLVNQQPATTHEALKQRLDDVVAAGGEGLMLHRGGSLYLAGRSDDLLKVKRYDDAEAVVVKQLPGDGKYHGQMGSLLVERGDGRRFRIGTGFSDDERANPPAIGSTITYKYFGYTVSGLPRFASFMRVRDDEPPGVN